MRSLHSLFISAILHCAYYYFHPSFGWMHDARMHREYDLAFLSVKRSLHFLFWHISVRPRVTGCNVTRATRHMHSARGGGGGARIVSRSDARLRFQLLDIGFWKIFRRRRRTCARVIRSARANNARPSINSKLIYDGADSWFVISCSQLRRSRYNNPLLIHVALLIVRRHSRLRSALR